MTDATPVRKLCFLPAAVAVCIFVTVAFFAGSAAATTGQLDQSYSASGPGGFVEVQQTAAQTFTPSVSGDLTDIGVELWTYTGNPGMPVHVEVTSTTAGAPDDSNVLGSGTIASNAIGGSAAFETTPITGTPYLVAGQQYAIILSVSTNGSGGYYETSTNYSNGDASGTAWWEFNSTPPFIDEGWDDAFETFMTPAAPPLNGGGGGPRGAYCTVTGNTTDSGQPLTPDTFVNLDDGQINSDPAYKGATPAKFVNGVGLTCGPVPASYTQHAYATPEMNVDAEMYPYYSN